MRRERERPEAGGFDLKQDPGGIVDTNSHSIPPCCMPIATPSWWSGRTPCG
jgi:hypothetical protein